MSHRCFLKNVSPHPVLPPRSMVFKATAASNITISSLHEATTKGYVLKLYSQADVEKLFTAKAKDALRNANLVPIPPSDMTDKLTLFVRGVEEELGKQSAEDLQDILEASNPTLNIAKSIS